MSAAASTSTMEIWASWEGHVVNGMYPLRRCLGSSDHSGVFLTESRNATPSDVAIKIVPAVAGHAEAQLSRWLTAAGLDHPNLVRIFEAGQCQVDGRPYLYALMEYADQDLAQLLQRRALTEEEAREMLMPMLSALAYLHGKKLVQGRVRPSNVLVVGDRLKLASDTICRVGEAVDVDSALSAYDSPELRETGRSAAGDIWALGVTICEALTRRQPLALHGGGNPVFPVDLSLAFRELASWCLSRRPSDRPEVAELEASLRGERTVPVAIPAVEPSALIAAPEEAVSPESPMSHSVPTEPVEQAAVPTATSAEATEPPAAQATATDASAMRPPALTAAVAAVPSPEPTAAMAVPSPAPTATVAVPTPAPTLAATVPTPLPTIEAPPVPPLPTTPAQAAVSAARTAPAAPLAASPSAISDARALPRSVPVTTPAAREVQRSAAVATPAARGVPPSATAAADTGGPASESRQPPSDGTESKPRYALGAASLATLLVVVLAGMKLLNKPSPEPASDAIAEVASDNASGGPSNDAAYTAHDPEVAAARAAESTTAPPNAMRARASTDRLAVRPVSTRPTITESNVPPAADLSSPEVDEFIPDVPASASRTIRGSVRVSVRVIVEKDGTVFAALADDRGPSRYFERLAIDAAKKWTFAPADTDEQRLMLIRFTFTRQGTTASATALR